MTMTAREMGKKGGRATTPAKQKAVRANLKLALKALRKKRLDTQNA